MANPEHLEILKQGVEAWNQWREQNRDITPNVRGAKLIEVQLNRAFLSGANLSRTILSGANLNEAQLSEANLNRAILTRASLRDADLSGAILSRADLRKADLGGANLSRADLRDADLSEANLRGADFSRATFSWVDLRKADLRGAKLSLTNLSGADFSGVDFSEADLRGANFRGTNLSEANLSRADLSEADLRETNFRGTNLSEANLSRADLRDADLSRAILRNATLMRANLVRAYLAETDLRGAILHDNIEIAERYEIEVEIALPQENINYIDLERLQMAIDNLMEVCEFELKGELDPVRGSWWQKLIFWSKDKTTQTAVNRILQTLKEVFVARSIGIPSAEETIKLTEAVDKVIKSLEPFDGGVIRLGKLLVVKGTLRGKSVLRVETISLSLAQKLADNPQLINMPQQLLLLIEEPEIANQAVSIYTSSDEPQGYLPPAESVRQLPPGGNS